MLVLLSALPLVAPLATGNGQPALAAAPLTVLSVSFVSPSAGWLLATPCVGQSACRTVVLRETVDGGRTWSAVPAPAATPATSTDTQQSGSVGTILFTSSSSGWAFGPALWQTADGGATWQRLSVPGGQVRGLAVGNGRVLALTERCEPNAALCSVQVYSAKTRTGDWRAIPGASGKGLQYAALAVSGGNGYLTGMPSGQGRPVLLAGPVDGTAAWRPLPFPCSDRWSAALAAALGGGLFLGCAGEPGAGNQLKAAYFSADGGHTWSQVTAPPLAGYLESASMNSAGTIFLSGDRMGIYVSWDRGRSWHESPSLASAVNLAGAGFPLTGSILTSTFGYAFQQGVDHQQVWLTRNGGRTWTSSTIR